MGKLPFKSSFVLGASCMWRNETQRDFSDVQEAVLGDCCLFAISKRALNCGSVSWVLYYCDCCKSFPIWNYGHPVYINAPGGRTNHI